MRILITVDPEIPVPPKYYGGIERIVDILIYSLKSKNHEIFLVANPESTNKYADAILGWPKKDSRGITNIYQNSKFLFKTVNSIKPDIIHSFSRLLYLYPTFFFNRIPVVQSYQRNISEKSTMAASIIAGRKLEFTSCGAHMVKNHIISDICTPIHNFTDTEYYIINNDIIPDYLFFLGRIEDIKGTKEAIEVAIKTNQRLIIAGNIQPGHEGYFETHIQSHLNNPLIEYIGAINDAQKLEYLHGAIALLFPIKWEEPFGIVMAEAMSCGVPVIGFRRGSVPEVVIDNETGFIVDTLEEMVSAVARLGQIDRNDVRQDCIRRFSIDVISNQYIALYKKMLMK